MSLLIATALLAGASATPETVIGRWKTETHNAIVEIARCGPSICGKILTSDALRANPSMKDANNSNTALRNRPAHQTVIITGRGCHREITELADTVSELRPVKHAFDAGIKAQIGIDY